MCFIASVPITQGIKNKGLLAVKLNLNHSLTPTHLTELTSSLEFIEYREISLPPSVGGNIAVITVLFIIMAALGHDHSKQHHKTLQTLLDYEDQCTVHSGTLSNREMT